MLVTSPPDAAVVGIAADGEADLEPSPSLGATVGDERIGTGIPFAQPMATRFGGHQQTASLTLASRVQPQMAKPGGDVGGSGEKPRTTTTTTSVVRVTARNMSMTHHSRTDKSNTTTVAQPAPLGSPPLPPGGRPSTGAGGMGLRMPSGLASPVLASRALSPKPYSGGSKQLLRFTSGSAKTTSGFPARALMSP